MIQKKKKQRKRNRELSYIKIFYKENRKTLQFTNFHIDCNLEKVVVIKGNFTLGNQQEIKG
jgi:hypothetical protein